MNVGLKFYLDKFLCKYFGLDNTSKWERLFWHKEQRMSAIEPSKLGWAGKAKSGYTFGCSRFLGFTENA